MDNLTHTIEKQSEQCVQCGLCAEHCPTYRLTHNENEAPRGRIALARALAQNKITLNEQLTTHLDHCLSCRACEAMCPSQVKYGSIIDNTKALIYQQQPKKLPCGVRLLQHYPRLSHALLRGYQMTRLSRLFQLLKPLTHTKLQTYERLVPPLKKWQRWQSFYRATIDTDKSVGLLLGCFNQVFDQNTIADIIKVITHLGYNVYIPPQQTCCGALSQHQGNHQQAEHYAKQNETAFAQLEISHIITFTTGCQVVAADNNRLPIPYMDINDWLSHVTWPSAVYCEPLNANVLIHLPCSQHNVLKSSQRVVDCLNRIPHLTLTTQAYQQCCGAAGSNMLEYPDTAEKLGKAWWQQLPNKSFDYIVSSNLGCQLHLSTLGKQRLLHPVSLLAKQLRFKIP